MILNIEACDVGTNGRVRLAVICSAIFVRNASRVAHFANKIESVMRQKWHCRIEELTRTTVGSFDVFIEVKALIANIASWS